MNTHYLIMVSGLTGIDAIDDAGSTEDAMAALCDAIDTEHVARVTDASVWRAVRVATADVSRDALMNCPEVLDFTEEIVVARALRSVK